MVSRDPRTKVHEIRGISFAWPDPTAKFRRAPTKVCKISVVEQFLAPWKVLHGRSPDLSPVNRPYTSFHRRFLVTFALDCFVSETSLVLYRKCHFFTYPLVFHSKFGDVPLELDRWTV